MRVPSSVAIFTAAAELANEKHIRSDILAENPVNITPSSACLNGKGKSKSKDTHLNQNTKDHNLTVHEGFDLPSRLAVCRALFCQRANSPWTANLVSMKRDLNVNDP